MACGCSCRGECPATLLYSCSGAANTGAYADAAMRALMKEGSGSGTCLAAVGAELSGFTESAKAARNIVIDGCPVACGKKIFERLGLPYEHVVVTELGIEKGKTPFTEEGLAGLVERIKARVGAA